MFKVFILSVRGQPLAHTPDSFRVRPDRQADEKPIENALARISRDTGMQVLAGHVAGYTPQGNFYEVTFGRPAKGTGASVPLSVVRLKILNPGHGEAYLRANPTYVRAPSVATLQNLPATASRRGTSPLSKNNAKELKELLDAGKPMRALDLYNEISNSNGVEYVGGTDGGIYYVNHGDSYDTTLLYDTGKGAVKVGSWGDIVERDRRFKDS